jgi:DNA-binding NtrC family response regulator
MPAKVLIIDDDRDILDVLELILMPEGYEIIKDTGLSAGRYRKYQSGHPGDRRLAPAGNAG